MTKKVKEAIERIVGLKSEFTADEILEAIKYLQNSDLLDRTESSVKGNSGQKHKNKNKPVKQPSDSVSRAVLDLEKTDTEKFEILYTFDRLLRSQKALRNMDDFRDIGIRIDKNFNPGKSRKDAIPRFLKLLSEMPLQQLKVLINEILLMDKEKNNGDEDYQKLANFLMYRK